MRYETQGTGKNETQRLVVYYKFVGYLGIDPTQCHPNYTADIREGVTIEYVSCEPSDSMKELFPEGYGVVDDDSFEEAETEQAETCSGHDNKKVDATKIRYIHLIWQIYRSWIQCTVLCRRSALFYGFDFDALGQRGQKGQNVECFPGTFFPPHLFLPTGGSLSANSIRDVS